MCDDGMDPFASLHELCHISSSQQHHMIRCPFAGDKFLSGIPVSSNMPALGFSATEMIEINLGSNSPHAVNNNNVSHSDSIIFRIQDGSPPKKLKIVDKDLCFDSPQPCLGCEAAKTLERVAISIQKLLSTSKRDANLALEGSRRLNFDGASPSNLFNLLEGDGSSKRKLNETLESPIEAVNEDTAVKKSNGGPSGENSCGKGKGLGEKRALPVSLFRHLNAQGVQEVSTRRSCDDKKKSMALFDVLRELAKEYSFDPSLVKMSALEAAKRGGITFP
ncbi:hypothetical protein M5689_012105 [Euphorbia peplus]|nr:hypothetical protein M5689_012105 [Euphorbia peplus]